MKKSNIPLILLSIIIVGSMISCKSVKKINYQEEFEKSQKAWLDFKAKTNNSYKYIVSKSSYVGFKWQTEITVRNGEVVKRVFAYIPENGLSVDMPESEKQWIEEGTAIGTHDEGANPITLEQIYDLAEQDWLTIRDNAKIYLLTENDGMISTCGYVEEGCMDDCFVGITIASITPL